MMNWSGTSGEGALLPRAASVISFISVLAVLPLPLAGGQVPAEPVKPLESRIGDTPPSVLKMLADAGERPTTTHRLTIEEQRTLAAAFGALPPLHRRVLTERLMSISFLDGMPNTALTSTVNPGEAATRYHWTIRAGVLHENVSQWLTAKERTLFTAGGSTEQVAIEAGKLDAILYVLLHEGAHVVDATLELTPRMPREGGTEPMPPTPFTDGIWRERFVATSPYRNALLERVTYRAGGKPLPMQRARPMYEALRRTPFVSVYASTNWHDDLAETLSVYHLTERLGQPFRIVIRDGASETFAYEPATSALVRRRFGQLAPFYAELP